MILPIEIIRDAHLAPLCTLSAFVFSYCIVSYFCCNYRQPSQLILWFLAVSVWFCLLLVMTVCFVNKIWWWCCWWWWHRAAASCGNPRSYDNESDIISIHGMQWRQWIWTNLWSDINDAILCVRQIVYMNKNGGF